jgi:hypothetical protein
MSCVTGCKVPALVSYRMARRMKYEHLKVEFSTYPESCHICHKAYFEGLTR